MEDCYYRSGVRGSATSDPYRCRSTLQEHRQGIGKLTNFGKPILNEPNLT